MAFNNTTVLAACAALKAAAHAGLIAELRTQFPKFADWTDTEIVGVCDKAVSAFQSKSGKPLERIVETALTEAGIPFKAQVHLNAEGIIVASKGVTIPDIVFGDPIVGTHISNYAVMSLKTTSRERAKLDSWTEKHCPKLFLYGTLSADYPTPEKFRESATRKVVTAVARKKDTRQFKLGFEDIVSEVNAILRA